MQPDPFFPPPFIKEGRELRSFSFNWEGDRLRLTRHQKNAPHGPVHTRTQSTAQRTMRNWIQQRTNLEKTLLSFSVILVLTLVLLILLGIAFRGGSTEINTDEEATPCWSNECIKTAGHILSSLGQNEDVCSDFYEYACGGYGRAPGQTVSVLHSATESIQASVKSLLEGRSDASDEELNAAKSLYKSCIAFEGLKEDRKKPGEVLNEIMSTIGTWPVVDTFFDESKIYLDDRLAALSLLGVPVAYKVEVVHDSGNRGSFLMKLTPGGPWEAGRTAMEIRSDSKLKTSLLSAFVLLGARYDRSATDADDILSVESQYATIEQDMERCNSTDHIASQELISELNRLMPETNWTILITKIQQVTGFQKPFPVELHCKEKIRDYLVYLEDLTTRSAYNYIGWRFFSSFKDHILPDFREGERSKMCLSLVEKYFPSLLHRALNLPKETLEKVLKITKDIQSGLHHVLSKTKLLTEMERVKLLKQFSALQLFISDYQKQSKIFQHLPQIDLENYTSAIIELRRQSLIHNFKKLDPSEAHKEIMKYRRLPMPNETLPFLENYLAFDLAAPGMIERVREPFFQYQGPEWLNYGSLGAYVAREILKILFDEKIPTNAGQCFLKSLKEHPNMMNNQVGSKLGEDLFLDAVSLEATYETVKDRKSSGKKYLPGLDKSEQQLFFISYAQSFCEVESQKSFSHNIPVRERINALVDHSQHFEEVFLCKLPKKVSSRCLY